MFRQALEKSFCSFGQSDQTHKTDLKGLRVGNFLPDKIPQKKDGRFCIQ